MRYATGTFVPGNNRLQRTILNLGFKENDHSGLRAMLFTGWGQTPKTSGNCQRSFTPIMLWSCGRTDGAEQSAIRKFSLKGSGRLDMSFLLYFLDCGSDGDLETSQIGTPNIFLNVMTSLPTLSSIPFILLSGIFINLFGPKGSTMLGLVSAIVSWLIMGLTPSITALFIGRAISGAAYAFIVTVSQPLVSELVSPKIRGVAASLPRFFSNLASLEINVANIFLPWHLTTTLCAAPFFLLLLSILFVPESPYWLVRKGRENAAISALKSVYPPDDIEVQFQEVKQCVTLKSEKPGVREQMHQMRQSSNYKPVMLMVIIYACYGSNGNSIITPYSTLLFTQAGMTLDPRLCTIILGVVQIVVVIIGSFITDLCGRRPLYIGSSILSVLSLVSTFVSLTFSFIPSLRDNFPNVFYDIFIRRNELSALYPARGVINLLGAFVVWRWLPETKGRPLVEIQKAFEQPSNRNGCHTTSF
ncbi:uncharacterized protein LOC143030246 [Oratosquilla oratoria]|uniref:uncharacterized protein LOC143030246 n=1 Tax=Oratosquilla oratoria TaxID=337810 RepID=UPI003F773466